MKSLLFMLPILLLVGCASVADQAAALQQVQSQNAAAVQQATAEILAKLTTVSKAISSTQPTADQLQLARSIITALCAPSGTLSLINAAVANMEAAGQKEAALAVSSADALQKDRADFWSYRQRKDFWLIIGAIVCAIVGVILLDVASGGSLPAAWAGVAAFFGHVMTLGGPFVYRIIKKFASWFGKKAAPIAAKLAPPVLTPTQQTPTIVEGAGS